MSKPIGGRGCKAPYQTTTIRIPIDIKPQIDKIINRFRDESLKLTEETNSEGKIEIENDDELTQLIAIVQEAKSTAKQTRDWIKHNQLISKLEEIINKK